MLYQMVELEDGAEVQYLGVYALKWRHDEWGPPSVGFVERNVEFNLAITYICAQCGGFAEVPFLAVEVFDSGTRLTCNRCGKDTVFNLTASDKDFYDALDLAWRERIKEL
jgi:DNA-directed RNA polymerase subunit RPC12/RpoP